MNIVHTDTLLSSILDICIDCFRHIVPYEWQRKTEGSLPCRLYFMYDIRNRIVLSVSDSFRAFSSSNHEEIDYDSNVLIHLSEPGSCYLDN